MRRSEGEQLVQQVRAELEALSTFLDWFEPQMAEIRATMLERARSRIAEMVGPEVELDPQRILQEAAVLADRADVAEEVVRLRSHLEHMEQRLQAGGAVGRTLDFICQELHRELNTLGSKCREPAVSERLVEAKAATERVREQVQNLE